jgi:hypothetical protein
MDQGKLSETGPPNKKRKPFPSPIQLKYIFPAGGLLKSSPNTFVRKENLKTRDFCSFIESPSQGLFSQSDLFLWGRFFDLRDFFKLIID